MLTDKLKYSENNGLSELEFAIVGVTFDNRQEILKNLYKSEYLNNIKIKIRLEHDKLNKFDKNAVNVILSDTEQSIGFVSKDFNQEIIPIIANIKDAYVSNMYMNINRNMGVKIKICFEG